MTYVRDFSNLTALQDIYFIPFYFQAVGDVSATTSGIRIIPLCLSQIVAVVAVGAIVSKTGHYVGPPKESCDFTPWRAN